MTGAGIPFPETRERRDVRVLGRRVAACLADTFLALCFAAAAFLPLVFVENWNVVLILSLMLVYVLLWCSFHLAHAALFDGFLGHTLGKRVFGIRVVRETDGRPPGPWRAALRASTFLFVDMFLGLPVMLRSPKRQRFGDVAANTLVVRDGRRR